MRIHAAISENAYRRSIRDMKFGGTGLTVVDEGLPAYQASSNARQIISRAVRNRRQSREWECPGSSEAPVSNCLVLGYEAERIGR
ncbi:MAG: hypothetical protein OXI87_06710 [Albidovulum sp.]|nr:hypothetical protein [Albidovulum sp.]MDE0531468.1 hypothetical protein [Albidovulum sp.]